MVWANFYANPTIYSQLPVPIIIYSGTILISILIPLAILDYKYFLKEKEKNKDNENKIKDVSFQEFKKLKSI